MKVVKMVSDFKHFLNFHAKDRLELKLKLVQGTQMATDMPPLENWTDVTDVQTAGVPQYQNLNSSSEIGHLDTTCDATALRESVVSESSH